MRYCPTCKFVEEEPFAGNPAAGIPPGTNRWCHLNPPQICREDGLASAYPPVSAKSWCSHHTPKKAPR